MSFTPRLDDFKYGLEFSHIKLIATSHRKADVKAVVNDTTGTY